jgi:hypothetical protein
MGVPRVRAGRETSEAYNLPRIGGRETIRYMRRCVMDIGDEIRYMDFSSLTGALHVMNASRTESRKLDDTV